MKIARLAVLGIALAAGVAAAFMINGSKGSGPTIEVAAPAPVVESEDVLVAAHALDVGALVGDSEIRWQSWPKRDIAAGMIRKGAEPNAFEDVKGSVSRGEFFAGEPMRRE